jgi:hypothetical protein
VKGVAELDAALEEPTPDAFVAVTVKVYAVPFVSPVTVHDVVAVVQVAPPGEAVAVYEVIAFPPFDAGAVHDSGTWPFCPLVAVTAVGAPGGPYGIADADAVLAVLVPLAFVAVTVNV